jgi:hypothetical protein
MRRVVRYMRRGAGYMRRGAGYMRRGVGYMRREAGYAVIHCVVGRTCAVWSKLYFVAGSVPCGWILDVW